MQTNGVPLEDVPTTAGSRVERDHRSHPTTLRPAVTHLREEVARLERDRERLRREIAELVRARDELRAAGETDAEEPAGAQRSEAPPTALTPLRQIRLGLDLPSGDDEMAAAFERFFDAEVEHDKSRDWILSDLEQTSTQRCD